MEPSWLRPLRRWMEISASGASRRGLRDRLGGGARRGPPGGSRKRASLRRPAVVVALAGLCALAGCSSALDELPPIDPPRADSPYRLGSGDEIRILVFDEPELSNSYFVGDAGTISVPLIGSVPAAGSTTDDLEERIALRLRETEVVMAPSVNVEVQTYRPFYILGEVEKPGQYPYVAGMTALTAAAIAGGYTFRARTDKLQITRTGAGQVSVGSTDPNALIEPGDVIFVHERHY